MILNIKNLHSYYDKSHILQGVNLELKKGELVCLLGRNGVGKSTTLKSIMGLVKPSKGSVQLNGRELRGLPPNKIACLGVGYVPEERRVFKSLTVQENLQIGIKQARTSADDRLWTIERVFYSFPRLAERRNNKGGHLSGGEQQMLTIARTLMGNPEVLLVDEPTEGLAPLIVESMLETLNTISGTGVTILMVEQNFKAAMKVADRFYIMSKGQIVFQGDGKEILAAEDIRKLYLEV
jgi:branched-chain amino acid transport system ATP-binding protein